MKLKLFLILLTCTQLNAAVHSQNNAKIALDLENVSLEEVIWEIQKKTNFVFMYGTQDVEAVKNLAVKGKNLSVNRILEYCLKNTELQFEITGNAVVIRKGIAKPEEYTIRGRVVDEKGEPLPGVTVMVKGTTLGTITDIKGEYKISLPKMGLTLQFSFMGMATQNIVVKDDVCNVILKEELTNLDEAVVVGYGTMRKKDITGAISVVDEKLLEESAASDIGTIIQGQIPGLHILTGSGSPGEPVQMQIRGVGSLSGNTSPLIVVDGVEMPSDFSINELNPAEVKSISVLKGASSAAIYGSRASAGVIMITTKRGVRNEKPLINYNYTYGTRQLMSDINVLNTEQFKLLLLEATRNSAQEAGYANMSDYLYYRNFTAPGYFGEVNTPWMKLLMQSASNQTHNLSMRGGGKSSAYSISWGLNDEKGMLVNTFNRRQNLSLNLNNDINSWLKSNISFRGNVMKRGKTENFSIAAEARPDLPCFNDDGSYYLHKYIYQGEERFETNPLLEAKERDNVTRSISADLSVGLTAQLLGGLQLDVKYAYRYMQQKERDFSPSDTFTGSGGFKSQKGELTSSEMTSSNNKLEFQAAYTKSLKKHYFDVTAVGTITKEDRFRHSITFADFPDDKTQTGIYQGVTFKRQNGYDRRSLLVSGVARANYNYDQRYLLTISWRADGSSRFSPDSRWSYFPAAAVGWVISKEKFFKKNKVVDFLKIRAAVGKVGMGYVQEYDWMTLYNSAEYLGKPAVVPGSMGNDNLKWEGTVSYDLGLDFGFFKGSRIGGTLQFYKKKTKDLLYNYTLSPSTGLNSAQINFAAIENRGIEFDIRFDIIRKRDLIWSFSFDIAKNINKITGLDAHFVSTPGSARLGDTVIEEGKSLGLFYGYKTDGIFQSWEEIERCEALNPNKPYQQKFSYNVLSPGDIKILDLSGDGFVNFASNCYEDKAVLGSSLPDFTGGFSTRFSWKGFTLSLQGSFSYGNMKSWEAEGRQFNFNPSRPKNLLDLALNRWTPENKTNKYPKIKLNAPSYGMTDFWLHDASYLKLQNISLTYRFPSKLINKTSFLSSAEVFGSIDNVHTFTKYPGPNPESYSSSNRIAGAAIDYTAYPQTRTFNVGLRLSIK